MDTLQYFEEVVEKVYDPSVSFKPCYKWIPFNTFNVNLWDTFQWSFKPCYKWIPFNTKSKVVWLHLKLNSSFKPCYKWIPFNTKIIIPADIGLESEF